MNLLRRLAKITLPQYEYEPVFGSRKVIKERDNDRQQHYYDTVDGMDLWTWYGEQIADLIPEGYILYGELVGYLPGTDTPIQKNYTYDCAPGECELYVYRVATINAQGTLADLSWDGVKQFCMERGLKWTPELARLPVGMVDEWLEAATDAVFYNDWSDGDSDTFIEVPVRLSNPKTVDEGVCLRQDSGMVPTILKAKSGRFLEYETKLLDGDEVDLESAA